MIKKGDFVELEYIGMLKDTKVIFDTTDEKVAKSNDIHSPKTDYGPITICIGQQHVIAGVDEQLEGKDIGKEYTIILPPEKAFGKKDAKMVQMIPLSKFTKEGIRPMAGLQVNVDGAMGVIKHVGGGRVLVDFNHPLAGQDLVYKFRVMKAVEDDAAKLKALLKLQFHAKDWEVDLKEGVATVSSKDIKLPPELGDALTRHVHGLIPSIKQVIIGQTA